MEKVALVSGTSGLCHNTGVALEAPKQDAHVTERSCDHVFGDELRILPQLRHPNIVPLYGACFDGGLTGPCLVTSVSLTDFRR